jgi:glycosyltransferase involved in cell wall biosynthesis
MKDIKISVVIPTYKRPALLKNCLKSLANQTLQEQLFEIIVVSDGPDRESEKVVSESSIEGLQHIRFLSLPIKKGPAAARNLGWKNALGTIIAFTDDDCLPDIWWLQNIVAKYNGEKEIAFTGKVVVPVSAPPTDFELNTKGLEKGEFVTANCVVTKAALQKIEGFDEAFEAAWREDSDLHFKLIGHGIPIIKLEEAIVVHPVRKAPWGISIKEQKKTIFNALLYKKYPTLYRQRIKSGPSWRYYLIIQFFALFVIAAIPGLKWMMLIALLGWILLTAEFTIKRLSSTRKTGSHIFEMIVTSVVIPFLSVYWTLYGGLKYRVLFF